jgi:hypothetical protein
VTAANSRGDLTIDREIVMLEIPRGDHGDVLRVTFTEATTNDGKKVAWHSIRVFYTDDNGVKKPGKAGVSIRGRELRPVTDALVRACGGPPQRTPQDRPAQRPAPAAPALPPAPERDDDLPF